MVSTVIIAYNEADRIEATLLSLSWCDDIVVVDSGSTDGTQTIAERYNARVLSHPFTGYGKQKQYACTHARNKWILSIDADEVLSEDLQEEIQRAATQGDHAAYRIPRRFRFLGRTFKHGRSSVDHPIRLFNSDLAGFDSSIVHESVVVNGPIASLRAEMLHDSYRDLHHYFEKFNEYTSKAAQQMKADETRRSLLLTVLSLPLYFFKHYIIGGHILNGREGLIWSLFSSWYPIVKVAKATLLTKSKTSR
ncbi:MAG: glycosyltransferase family 2 protein [Bacteroidetes bacterium]|nr:glycosyltransferase family 2 protein [Bacteroidota bacterium]